MRKIEPSVRFRERIKRGLKCFLFGVMSVIIAGGVSGCSLGDRGEYLAESNRTEKEQAGELMQSVIEALEAENAEALKNLFSVYARENSYNLDEKIQELIDFYPGSNGGYEGNVSTHRTADYGDIIYVITPKYTVTNDDESYEVRLTAYIENDVEAERVGLYSIQVMTEEAKPDGFKWRDEEDAPGVYVLE